MAAGESAKKHYQPQGHVVCNDGRELELLRLLYAEDSVDELRGSPERVLATIDAYGQSQKFLMNVGQDKGKAVTDLIEESKPEVMVELGGYVGYSAVLFGNALRKAGGRRYWSLERDPVFAAIVRSTVDLAGLSEIVRVIVGPSDTSLRRLHHEGQLSRIDMMFLDHHKPAYLADLKLCETLGLITPGSVMAADNVIRPGNPPYLQYVRMSVEEKRQMLQDALMSDPQTKGNPNLRYESRLVEGLEPTGLPDGVEITRCVGEETA